MKKQIVYHPVYQKFSEYDEDGNLVKTGSFKIPQRTQKLIENEKATIVFLEDGSKGVALVHPADSKNETFGRKLAYLRAKLVSVQKEIKELLKLSHQ